MTINLALASIKSAGSSTTRTLGARFADVVNVIDWGAVGDGVHDDTLNIQAAINAAAYKIVFFPPGTYLITASLVPPPSGNVYLEGGGIPTIQGNFADFLIKNNPSSPGAPTIIGIDGFYLSNTHTSTGFDLTTGCIYTDQTQNGWITNCIFATGWNFIVYGSSNFFNYLVQNCVGTLPSLGTTTQGGPIGLYGGAASCIINCNFLGGYCGFMIGGGVNAASGGFTSMFRTRTESGHTGVWAGAKVSGSSVVVSTCQFFTLIGHESERCGFSLLLQSVSAAQISSCSFSGTIGPVVSSSLSFAWSSAGGGTATCTFAGPTLDSNGWTTGTRVVMIEAVTPAGWNTYPGGATATYVSPNSFSYPLASNPGAASGGDWSFAQASGIWAEGMANTTISSVSCNFGVLNPGNPGIDLYVLGNFSGANNLLMSVISNSSGSPSWAMPPNIGQSTVGSSQKAGTQYIMCNNPAGSTLDAAGNAAGMTYADLPGGTNISLGGPVDGMEYDIIDDNSAGTFGATSSGGGTRHARVRYNGTNWTVMGI